MKVSLVRSLVLFGLVATFGVTLAHAQGAGGYSSMTMGGTSAASYYFVAKPGELTMQVNIWGYVKNPGRYEVATSTDLIQLLSYAGGPIPDAKLDGVKVTRFLRRETGISRGEFYVDLEDLAKVDQSKLTLYPGDTIFLDHSSWSSWRDTISLITTIALVATSITSLVITSRR
jgi:hypothetical protein